jgi:hypothetical protein
MLEHDAMTVFSGICTHYTGPPFFLSNKCPKEASDLIDPELAKDTPDGSATPKQIAIARALAAACKLELVMLSPTRREAASEIQALRCVADISRKESWPYREFI